MSEVKCSVWLVKEIHRRETQKGKLGFSLPKWKNVFGFISEDKEGQDIFYSFIFHTDKHNLRCQALFTSDGGTHTTALWGNHATIIIPEWNEWMKKPKPHAFKYLFQDNQLVSDKGALNLYAFNLCAILTFSLSHDSQHSPEGWSIFLIQAYVT